MFTTVSPTARWWLIALLIAWAVLLFGGFIVGKPNPEGTRRMTLWGRLGSSFVLVVAAWSWYWFGRSSSIATPLFWIALGMTLGWIGDMFMAKIIPIKEPVIGGMSAFGLGHVAYIIGFMLWGAKLAISNAGERWIALIVWLIFGALGWYFIVWRGQKTSILHRLALPYALLLASTAGVATGLALSYATLWLLVLGAALFLLSDLILATQLFNGAKWRGIGDVVWFTYGPGQMLIVYAMGLLLSIVNGKQ